MKYNNKTYYFFGEIPKLVETNEYGCSHQNKCYEIGNVIDKIISEENMTDIFLEAKYTNEYTFTNLKDENFEYKPDSNMFKYHDFISECLSSNKNLCPSVYKDKARFHYTDIRLNQHLGAFDIMFALYIDDQNSAWMYNKIKNAPDIVEWYFFFLGTLFTSKDIFSTKYALFTKSLGIIVPQKIKKIQKQIQKMDEQHKNILFMFAMRSVIVFQELYDIIISKINYEKYREYFIKNLCLRQLVTLLIMTTMDIYLLARMFSTPTSDVVIVYAGSAHIKNYIKFFQLGLGVVPEMYVFNKSDNGVDLPKETIQLTSN